MAALTVVLEAQGLSKKFGGVLALDQLDLSVARNKILGLIGPNGSGKTTFFNVVTGIYGADGGSVVFDGINITQAAPRTVYNAGISRTFQRSRLSLELSIFDNIMIGNHKRLNQGLWFNLVHRSDFKREFEQGYRAARDLLDVFEPELAGRMFEPAAGLPMIDRRRIEICRALISEPKLLLLDEPSAGMTHDETTEPMDDILLIRTAKRTSRSSLSSTKWALLSASPTAAWCSTLGARSRKDRIARWRPTRWCKKPILEYRYDRQTRYRRHLYGLWQGRRPRRRVVENRAWPHHLSVGIQRFR